MNVGGGGGFKVETGAKCDKRCEDRVVGSRVRGSGLATSTHPIESSPFQQYTAQTPATPAERKGWLVAQTLRIACKLSACLVN